MGAPYKMFQQGGMTDALFLLLLGFRWQVGMVETD